MKATRTPVIALAAMLASGAWAQPAPPKPYKAVIVTPPAPVTDPALDTLRKLAGEAAQKKDRTALMPLVVAEGFFWQRDSRDRADKHKSGLDNLSTALSLTTKGGAGWDILFSYTDDPTASPLPAVKGVLCAPGEPSHNAAAFAELVKSTQSDVSEWGYTLSPATEVHEKAQASAPVIEKLGPMFVRVAPDNTPGSAAYQRIITPSGKAGFVTIDAVAPLGSDQLCYVKDGGSWKIGGYIGGGESQ
ncbi:MAG TPA: hypothetical protein VGM57_05465 [Pseudolabrys sp.]